MKHTLLLLGALSIAAIIHTEQMFNVDEDGNIDFTELGKDESSLMYEKRFRECFEKANQYFSQRNTDKAIKWYLKAIKKNENSPQLYFNLGLCYEIKKEYEEAIDAYKDAILHRLDYPKAHEQLAKLLHKQGDLDNAIIHFEQAVKYDPQLVESAVTVARLLSSKERYKDAVAYFEIGVAKKQDDVQLRFEYANTLNTVNQTEKALNEYQQLLAIKPNDTGILYNTAYTLKKLGRLQDAMPYYEKTLTRKPSHSEAHFSLGLAHLIMGDFKRGWQEYEWRWQRNTGLSPRDFKQPLWDRSPLHGKVLFLHAEQGLGDTFQFIRYAQEVKVKFGGTIIVAVQKPLQTIIARCCPYIDRVITLDYVPQHFDYHAPLMTLPKILDTQVDTVPCPDPYIEPDPTLVEHWRRKLADDKNLKVGICWQGNSKYSTPFLRAVVAAKSLPMNKFTPLGTIPGVTLYSLQKENGVDQLKNMPANFKLVTFDETFDKQHGRFMDTAALMKNLDVVVTIDTSICHLAGAVGVPVWVMVPEPPDWRWMLKRNDSPWYPHNMRLFRQPTVGDWESVVQTIRQELEEIALRKENGQKPDLFNKPKPPTPAAPKEPEINSEQLQENNICDSTSLHAEQQRITKRLKLLSQELVQSKISPDDEQFMRTIESIYLLNSMKTANAKKIAALEG